LLVRAGLLLPQAVRDRAFPKIIAARPFGRAAGGDGQNLVVVVSPPPCGGLGKSEKRESKKRK
jgi:hypothetical protein